MRSCPKCKSRNRMKVMNECPFIDTACADCGYIFKEERFSTIQFTFERIAEEFNAIR